MSGRLDRKVAVITGGASGIGLATVELFIEEGACVVCADLQDEKGEGLERRFPGRLAYTRCDVTDERQLASIMNLAADRFGGLDILFNNAGHVGMPGNVSEVTSDGWDAVFALLVRAPALGMKHALPFMQSRGAGSIINTASIAGLQAGGPLAYSSAKAAVIHMTRCAAAELSPRNIRVNAICPGMIATPLFGASFGLERDVADALAGKVEQVASGFQPIPRAGMPRDVAEAALYLASDASGFVTGSHMLVDGGITIGLRSAWEPNDPSSPVGIIQRLGQDFGAPAPPA